MQMMAFKKKGTYLQQEEATETTGLVFFTSPSRRRSSTGSLASGSASMSIHTKHPSDQQQQQQQQEEVSHALCQSAGSCCTGHSCEHHSHHQHQQHGPECDQHHSHPGVPAAAAQPQPSGFQHQEAPNGLLSSNTGHVIQQQRRELLLRTISSGPVTTRIHAAAICCPMESRLIHSILDQVPGVMSVDVMVVTKMVFVHHDPAIISPAALVAALNSAGLQASLNKHSTGGGASSAGSSSGCSSSCGGCCAGPATSLQQQQKHSQVSQLWQMLGQLHSNSLLPPLSVLLAAALLLLNLVLLLPGLPVPQLLRDGLLGLVAAFVAVPPVLKKAWIGLKNKNLDMNCLVVVALCGAVGLGDWFEAGALVVLFTLAEWLEERCVKRAAGALEDILKLQPETALVIVESDHQHHAQEPKLLSANGIPASGACHVGCCTAGSSSCCSPGHEDSTCSTGCNSQQHSHSDNHVKVHCHEHRVHCGGVQQQQPDGCCSKMANGSQQCCSAACGSSSNGSCTTAAGHQHVACCHGHAGSSSPEQHAPVEAGCRAKCECSSGTDKSSCNFAHSGHGTEQQQRQQHGCHNHHHHCHGHHHHGPQQQQQQQQQQQHTDRPAHCHETGKHGHECCQQLQKHQHQHAHSPAQQHQHSRSLLPMPVSHLPVGALVLVRPGDKVPVDGTIESGSSVLDESVVTGEAKPVTKAPGDAVLAGTVNSGSVALKIRATAAAGDSTVARLGALMESAAASKSRHDMAVETFARYYTPAIVLAALLTAALGSAVQPAEWRHWTYMSLVVLVTGCPCALVISTPVASVAGLTRAARKGVLIKGGRALELLGNLTAASFDKSGTLTEGHFQLTQIHTFGGFSQQQALRLAAMLEQHSNHPIAHAIIGAAAARGCMSSSAGGAAAAAAAAAASDVTEVAGKGLQGKLQGQAIAVGSWGFAQELLAAAAAASGPARAADVAAEVACSSETDNHPGEVKQQKQQQCEGVAAAKQLLSSASTEGCTVVCLVVDGQLVALLLLSDTARADALAALKQLQQLGVRCWMMTGDSMGAAAHVAGQLGIDINNVCAELLPQEKLEMIETLRHRIQAEQHTRTSRQMCSMLSWWNPSRWGYRRGSKPGFGGCGSSSCSSCGEPVGECSCHAALASGNSSGSAGGAIIGSAASSRRQGFKRPAAAAGTSGVPNSSSSSGCGSNGVAQYCSKPHRAIIAHVGDGINDAPALAGADVGIAMGVAGAALAVDAADVALFSNNLTSLPFVVSLGRRAGTIIAVNTVFACSIKLVVLAAAAAGVASLWLSLLADVGSSLLVTLHALTLLRFETGAGAAGQQHSSKGPGSRLLNGSGPITAAHDHSGHGGCSSDSCRSRSGSPLWTRLLAWLPGGSWLQSYQKLADHTPASASVGPSRLNSLTGRMGLPLSAASGPSLTPKASAAQELREIAILAGAAAGRVGGDGSSSSDDGHSCQAAAATAMHWPVHSSAAVGAGGRHVQAEAAKFVLDDESC